MNETNEIEFKKLNLKEGDALIISVNCSELTARGVADKFSEIRNDPFVKYVESNGHKVFVTHQGLEFSILRLNPTDKVVAYADVTNMTEIRKDYYINKLKESLSESLKGYEVIVVESNNNSPRLRIKLDELEVENND